MTQPDETGREVIAGFGDGLGFEFDHSSAKWLELWLTHAGKPICPLGRRDKNYEGDSGETPRDEVLDQALDIVGNMRDALTTVKDADYNELKRSKADA